MVDAGLPEAEAPDTPFDASNRIGFDEFDRYFNYARYYSWQESDGQDET